MGKAGTANRADVWAFLPRTFPGDPRNPAVLGQWTGIWADVCPQQGRGWEKLKLLISEALEKVQDPWTSSADLVFTKTIPNWISASSDTCS